MSTIADIKLAVFELPPPQAVELIEQLDDYRDALMASKRTLELLDQQEADNDDQWLGE